MEFCLSFLRELLPLVVVASEGFCEPVPRSVAPEKLQVPQPSEKVVPAYLAQLYRFSLIVGSYSPAKCLEPQDMPATHLTVCMYLSLSLSTFV